MSGRLMENMKNMNGRQILLRQTFLTIMRLHHVLVKAINNWSRLAIRNFHLALTNFANKKKNCYTISVRNFFILIREEKKSCWFLSLFILRMRILLFLHLKHYNSRTDTVEADGTNLFLCKTAFFMPLRIRRAGSHKYCHRKMAFLR